MNVLSRPELAHGSYSILRTTPSKDMNNSFQNILARFIINSDVDRFQFRSNEVLIIVNLSEFSSDGHVHLSQNHITELGNRGIK